MPSAPSSETLLQIIAKLMTELHPDAARHRQVTLDSGLDRDLGLDSLARMELLSRLEKEFATHLPEKVLVAAQTPRDLLRHLQETSPSFHERNDVSPETMGSFSTEKRRAVGFSAVKSLLEVLERQVEQQGDIDHIILLQGEEETRVTYAALQRESLQAAARLRRMQIEPGQTVALMLPTGLAYFATFMGTLYCGGIPVPLYPPARPAQIEEHIRRHRKILANAGATILVTVAEVKGVGRLLQSQVPELQHILTADEFSAASAEPIVPRRHAGDIAFLQYTSGSTGDPKGVVLAHANLLANIEAMGKACEVTANDIFVSWLPLYHDMGLIGAWLGSLCHGCPLVVMSPLSFLARPQRWLRAIHRYGGTLSASPNFGYEICATRLDDSDIEGLDLGSWRMAFNGAEPVLPDTLRRFARRFKPFGFDEKALAPVYGLAESTVGLAFPAPGSGIRIDRVKRDIFAAEGAAVPADESEKNALEFAGCGRPLPGHQLRVVDHRGRELPERQEGRLQFRGPSSTSGYFRNRRQTAGLFAGDWLETGDRAYIAAGELYLTGRHKDIIIRAGRNIYPHELEEAVGNIDGIRKGCTAVFGSKGEDSSSERLVVLTESRQRASEEHDRLKARVHDATVDLLGMAPDDIVIGEPGTVLKTSSGKIRRSACRQLYESGHIGRRKSAVWLQLARLGLAGIGPTARRTARDLRALAYAGYCWLVLGVFAAYVWSAVMVLPSGRCWGLAASAVRTMCRLCGLRVCRSGLDDYPEKGAHVLVANHMSYLDSIILVGTLPEPCRFVAKAELSRNPLLRRPLRKLGVFFVQRFDAEKGVADAARIREGVRGGAKPLFFAEGTLQRMPGLLPFQMGAFLLASEEQLAVVPVIIRGTRNILRGGSWFPRRGTIRIDFAKACAPKEKGWQGAILLRDEVRRIILARLGEPDLSGEFTSLLQTELGRTQSGNA